MKINLDWLNAYLDQPVSAHDVERVMTDQGFPVEGSDDQGGGDVTLDIEVTSNRGDCLSHVGAAREVAAGLGRQLVTPECDLSGLESGQHLAVDLTRIDNDATDLCPLYLARVIQGVNVAPSPDWLVRRLETIGLRPVNNVVDVTNFVLHEFGQPLHAFDMTLLGEGRIVVRRAARGESFTAIDDTKHKLGSEMLVIADAAVPVAVAGVMGGLESAVVPGTTNVLLESARFDPLSVRTTSRALKLASDSSYRFERGVDPLGVDRASKRAAKLIVKLAGGTLAQGVVRTGVDDPPMRSIDLRIGRCNQRLGTDLHPDVIVDLLGRLDLAPQPHRDGDTVTCTTPTWRLDLHREIDLIEEVARMHGLDNIAMQPRVEIIARHVQPGVAARARLGQVMVAHGYHESITFSFVSPKAGRPFVDDDAGPVMIDDERRKAEPMLRPSVVPSLLACRKSNLDVGNNDVRLYETAAAWVKRDGRIAERQELALLCDAADQSGFGGVGSPTSHDVLRDVRGTLEELADQLIGNNALSFDETDSPLLQTGATILKNGKPIGSFGLLASKVLGLFGLQQPVVMASLDLPALIDGYPPARTVTALARFPGIERDLSVVVDEAVRWGQVADIVKHVDPPKLESTRYLGTYRGKQVPKGKKSVSFRMTYRDPATTLRHEQVDEQVDQVARELGAQVGAQLRQ